MWLVITAHTDSPQAAADLVDPALAFKGDKKSQKAPMDYM